MKFTRFLVSLMLLAAVPAMAMTDTQVINYIKTQTAAGKSQDQIGQELLAKGVTPDQIKRIKAQYEKQASSGATAQSSGSQMSRMRLATDQSAYGLGQAAMTPIGVDEMTGEYIYANAAPVQVEDIPDKIIYGHDIFNSKLLTFEPNANMATPQNYRLGPGDEVIIDIWGASEDNIRSEISPDGSIVISQIGPVHLNGMTVAEANKHVKNIFARKYAGVGSETDVNLTLGNIRSIQIDVMGEVSAPGSFRLSPFSNVFHAIYSAGGINDIGSLRNIQVMRNGKVISNLDLYDYIFKGKDTGNVRLQEGDVVIVPPYSELIKVNGNVKRPMYYEMKPTESLSKLLEYAGGFAGDAYTDVVNVERLKGTEKTILTIDRSQFPSYTLADGDVVTVGEVTNKYSNKVAVSGSVNRPGRYAINDEIQTVRQLINKADGLSEDAYLDRAIIYREKPDLSLEVLSINIGDLMDGTVADIALNKNDSIIIANVNNITERGPITISGLVRRPGTYPYATGSTVQDIVLQAGGLLEGASTARVEVARRVVDQHATNATSQIAQMFTFSIGDDADSRYKDFELMPYDVIHIRKSPTYYAQQFVNLDGQLLFPGQYTLQTRNERVSQIVERAGGLLESAYVKGAYLKRRIDGATKQKQIDSMKKAMQDSYKEITDPQKLLIQQQQDSLQIAQLEASDYFNVGIDLEKAMAKPGSTYDFVLMDGDQLVVPEQQSTVKINGEVLYPNSVVYVPGKKLKYYVEQAGGYGENAKKNKAYIVYMNGSVARAKNSTTIEPGCQIVIPTKNSKKFDWAPIITATSTLGSVATLAATVVALIRK